MTCYVDRLQQWPTTTKCFAAGSCHLIADTLDELHAMARRIGLKRAWFQDARSARHYMPENWTVHAWKATGGHGNRNSENVNRHKERIWFSPFCLPIDAQPDLFSVKGASAP